MEFLGLEPGRRCYPPPQKKGGIMSGAAICFLEGDIFFPPESISGGGKLQSTPDLEEGCKSIHSHTCGNGGPVRVNIFQGVLQRTLALSYKT